MKCKCNTKELVDQLKYAYNFISQRNLMSLLSNIYLEVKDNKLIIKATDKSVGFISKIDVEESENGCITVYFEKFSKILNTISSVHVYLEVEDDRILIKNEDNSSSKKSFSLRTLDAEQYPELLENVDREYFSLKQEDFNELIEQTHFSVGLEKSQLFLTGVNFERTENGIILVSTDGRRLAYTQRKISENLPNFKNVIIPVKILKIVKSISNNEGLIDIALDNDFIYFRFNGLYMYSNLINASYPNYRKVIPDSFKNSAIIPTKEILDAINGISIIVDDKNNKKIYLELSNNKATIKSDEEDIGFGEDTIDCVYDGEDITFSLNYLYLSNPLKAMKTNKFKLEFNSKDTQCKISPEPESDYFHIFMPMIK